MLGFQFGLVLDCFHIETLVLMFHKGFLVHSEKKDGNKNKEKLFWIR